MRAKKTCKPHFVKMFNAVTTWKSRKAAYKAILIDTPATSLTFDVH